MKAFASNCMWVLKTMVMQTSKKQKFNLLQILHFITKQNFSNFCRGYYFSKVKDKGQKIIPKAVYMFTFIGIYVYRQYNLTTKFHWRV